MGCDCCGTPAPAIGPDLTPITTRLEEKSSCGDSCCDSNDTKALENTGADQEEPISEKSDNLCSNNESKDNKTEDDAPDCCRGKGHPCCDASCLDRLAMRECEISAVADPGLTGQANCM